MKQATRILVALSLAACALAPVAASAETTKEKLERLRKKTAEVKEATAEKKAAEEKAAADQKAADEKAADEKAAADKKAADAKAAADKKAADAKAAADTKAAADKAADQGTGGKDAGVTPEKAAAGPAPSAADAATQSRAERRRTTVDGLRKRWGRLLADEKGRAELKLHAERVASLQRIRSLAEEKKDKKSVQTVDELLTQEDERNSKAMNALREGAIAGGAK